jgi:predicted permease
MEYIYLFLIFTVAAIIIYSWGFMILKYKKQRVLFLFVNLLIEVINYFVSIVYYLDLFGEDKIGIKAISQSLIVLCFHTVLMFVYFNYMQRRFENV